MRPLNPLMIGLFILTTVFLNAIHIFSDSEWPKWICCLPFCCFVPYFVFIQSSRRSPTWVLYMVSLTVFIGVGIANAARFNLSYVYGLGGGFFTGMLFPTVVLLIWSWTNDPTLQAVAVVCTWTTIDNPIASLYGIAVTLPLQLYRMPILLQPISILGSAVLGAFLIASNWLLALALHGKARSKNLLLWFCLITGWVVISSLISYSFTSSSTGTSVRISTISPGRIYRGDPSDLINMTITASNTLSDFIVWPEVYIRPDHRNQSCVDYVTAKILPRLQTVNSYVIVGCQETLPDPGCSTGNLAITIGRNGSGIIGTYGKQHPVTMIGEKSCKRNGYSIYPIDDSGLSFSTLICYDADFEDSSAIVRDMGASLILFPSQDWGAARSHFAASVFRAVENRVAIAKSDWGWDSAIISPTGTVESLYSSPQMHRAILTGEPKIFRQKKAWNRIQFHIFPIACILVTLVLVVKSIRSKRPPEPSIQTSLLA